jgi:hypothetical protein
MSRLKLLTRASLMRPSSGLALLRLLRVGGVMVAVRLVAVSVVASVLSLLRLFEIVWDRCLFRNSGRMGGTSLTRLGDRLALGAENVLHELGSRFEGFAAIDTVDGFSSTLPLGRRLRGLRFVRLVDRSHCGIARGRLVSRVLLLLMLRVHFWSSRTRGLPRETAAESLKDGGPSKRFALLSNVEDASTGYLNSPALESVASNEVVFVSLAFNCVPQAPLLATATVFVYTTNYRSYVS